MKSLITAVTLSALAAGLVAWIFMPWPAVLGATILLALWLRFTKVGRQALAITALGLASLPQRFGAASVIVVGIAGVVGVLVAMLAMGEGFKKTLSETGNDATAIILRGGSLAETNSSITRDQLTTIANLAGIARDSAGHSLISPELSQPVNLPSVSNGTDSNALVRGVGAQAWSLRPNVKIIAGRKFDENLRELVVGQGAMSQFQGLGVGREIDLANHRWTIVGEFASGDAYDSELWGGSEIIASTYQRPVFQSVIAKLAGKDGFNDLKAAVGADPRLKLDVMTTRDYFSKQSEGLTKFIKYLSWTIGAIMAVGAVFGALNTMYATISVRAREIGTMRALGFRGTPVVVAVMLETMALALVGGLMGAGVVWLIFNGYTVSTLGNNFTQVVFQFRVSPDLLWTGFKWALGIGLVGGLFPALRAARQPVVDALRAV
jgi:putative ABC transport system permease protein